MSAVNVKCKGLVDFYQTAIMLCLVGESQVVFESDMSTKIYSLLLGSPGLWNWSLEFLSTLDSFFSLVCTV